MSLDRRTLLATITRLGVVSPLFPGALYTLAAQAQSTATPAGENITPAMIDQAAQLAGVVIAPEQKAAMLESLADQRKGYAAVRALNIPNSVAPAYIFVPRSPLGDPKSELIDLVGNDDPKPMQISMAPAVRTLPANLEDLAFSTVRELAEYVRTRKVSSLALTEMYLQRLKRYDPLLHFVVTYTEERAMTQAREADREVATGRYRGPLHGLPWGAKDLLAVKGYPTTWGAGGFEHQAFPEDAEVVKRLDQAGAVLLAKTTLGALASGDVWFGGRTRNPWNPKQGSSGSSAGSASAVSAGCLAFAIGSETLGSLSSPSTRCGVTALRPTFGLVPRTGAMALSWTMDKLGPIARSVEDCAIVLSSIHGPDGHDLAVPEAASRWNAWNAALDWKHLRIGYFKDEFEPAPHAHPDHIAAPLSETDAEKKKREAAEQERTTSRARREYDRRYDLAALDRLRAMGVSLTAVELPKFPYGEMTALLTAEAAAAFDDLTMSGRDHLLTAQGPEDWPNLFRIARFYPAVEYIQANRARTMVLAAWARLFLQVDVIVTPTPGEQLLATNLTGHPAVILPNGLRGNDAPVPPALDTGDDDSIGGPGTPVSLTFLGQHYQEAKLCAFARAYQQAAGFEKLHPSLS